MAGFRRPVGFSLTPPVDSFADAPPYQAAGGVALFGQGGGAGVGFAHGDVAVLPDHQLRRTPNVDVGDHGGRATTLAQSFLGVASHPVCDDTQRVQRGRIVRPPVTKRNVGGFGNLLFRQGSQLDACR